MKHYHFRTKQILYETSYSAFAGETNYLIYL